MNIPAPSMPGLGGRDPQSSGGVDGTHTLGRVGTLPPLIPGQYPGRRGFHTQLNMGPETP